MLQHIEAACEQQDDVHQGSKIHAQNQRSTLSVLACARQAAAASLAAAACPRTSACVCCGSGPHLGESRNSTALPAAAPL